MKVVSPSLIHKLAAQLTTLCCSVLEYEVENWAIAQNSSREKDLQIGNGPRRSLKSRGLGRYLQILTLIILSSFLSQTLLRAQTAHFGWAQVTLANTGFDSYGQVAVDTSGNVFFVDGLAGAVKEMVAAGGYATVKTLGGGFTTPQGVAVDASGNVFVADEGTGYSGAAVKKIPLNCTTSSCVTTLGNGFAFYKPAGVAVDGNGNVFVADLFGPIYEIPTSGSVKTLNYGFSIPQGVAVDGTGNIFVADTGNSAVKEIPIGCASSSCVKVLGGGFSYPDGVAVDGSGNVFVADTLNNILKEIPANCLTSSCVKPLGTFNFSPYGLAVDASGNVYAGITSSSWLVKVYPGTVDFGSLAVGQTGAAISLTFTIDSAGTLGTVVISASEFINAGTGTCKALTTFSAGNTCTLDVAFKPQAVGLRTGTVTIANSSGNAIATANVQGTGTGTSGTVGTTTSLSSSLNPSSYGQTVIFTVTVVATSGTATPTGTVLFSVDGSAVGSAITLSGGSGTGTTSTLASGTHSIGAAYTPSTGSAFIASNATPLSQVVNKVTPGVTVSPSSSSVTTAQSLSVTVAVNGGTGNPTPTGTVTLSGGGYTSAATTLSSGSATMNIPAGSLAVGSDTLTASYTPDSTSTARYTTATGSAPVTVTNATKTTPAVTVTPSPSTITTAQALTVTVGVAGTPTPTGTVLLTTFGYSSASISLVGGNAAIVIPAGSLASGIYTLTVTYTPDSNSTSTYNTATGSSTVTVTNPVRTTPSVSVTPSSSTITTAQALSVSVAVNGSPTPTGTVTLIGGGYTSAATALSGGSATINILAGSLTIGSDQLTVTYTPDSTSSSIYNAATGSTTITVTQGGTASGTITTIAGNGVQGFTGDGGVATSAELYWPLGVVVDASGNIYFADRGNARVRKVSPSGVITTIAGNGISGFTGDGGAATSAELNAPWGVAVDPSGNVYIADLNTARIRKISTSGIITTVAGNGTYGFAGDGGAATSAELNGPVGVALDANGNIFIADASNNRIRKVSSSGIITTVAGNGIGGFTGDGGAATSAELNAPEGVAVDAFGSIYIADFNNARIRKVSPSGIITTVAGNGTQGFTGDGEAATSAEIGAPTGVAVDSSGGIYIAIAGLQRIRKVTPAGIIFTAAGNGYTSAPGIGGYSGDGGPATSAELNRPNGVALDASGNFYIADTDNNVIRKVTSNAASIPTISGLSPSSATAGGTAFTLTINGTNFDSGASVFWGSTALATTYVSATQLTAAVPASLIAASGTASVTVTTSAGSSAAATFTVAAAKVGPIVLVTPSSSSITTAQSLSVTVAVAGGTGNPIPTGTVILTMGSYTSAATSLSNGNATINIAAGVLSIGANQNLTATYSGDSNYTSAAGSSPVTVTAPAKTTPTVTVTPSSSSITTAQALTVTVAVSGGNGAPTATGSVTLTSGSYNSAATIMSNGSAQINIPAGSLAVGSDTLTASYSGDSNYNAGTGTAPVTVSTAVNPSFTVGGTSVNVVRGATTGNTSTITVTPAGGFTGSVALTAALTSSPAGAQYPPTLSFGSTSPVSIAGTTAGSATLTISSTAATSATLAHPKRPGLPWYSAGGATLACILLFGIPKRRRRWRTLLGTVTFLVALTGGMLACGGGKIGSGGGGGTRNLGTTAGTYTITVIGTSGSTTANGTVTLTVQ